MKNESQGRDVTMKSRVLQAAGRPRASDVMNESPLMGISLKRGMKDDSAKQLKEMTAARDRKQYKALADSVSFHNRFYHRDFCPGDTLWQYLAVNPVFSSGELNGRSASRSRRRKRARLRPSRSRTRPSSARFAKEREYELRLLVPDTVVQFPSGSMVWLYTDRNGIIRRIDDFDKETFLERFGNGDQPSAITAVRKEACFSVSRSDPDLCKFLGSTTTCLNDRLVREFANSAFQPSARLNQSLTIQKFLKSKGRRASFVRTVHRTVGKPQSWTICSRKPFAPPPSAEIEKEPRYMAQHFTATLNTEIAPLGCEVYSCTSAVAAPTSIILAQVVAHLQRVIGRKFIDLVGDFCKDDDGRWWLLQIKAFRLAPINLLRRALAPLGALMQGGGDTEESQILDSTPAPAPSVAQLTIPKKSRKLFSLVIEDDFESKPSDTTVVLKGGSSSQVHPMNETTRKRRKFVAQTERLHRCKFTLAGFVAEDLACTMTGRMITELKNHLSVRLPAARFQSLFAGQSYPIDATYMSQPLHVCLEAYDMYRCEAQLKAVEKEFAIAMGIPTADDVATETLALNRGILKSGILAAGTVSAQDVIIASVKAFTRKKCKNAGKIRALNDAEMRALPEKLSMFRLMVALHEIIDFPRELLEMPGSSTVGDAGGKEDGKDGTGAEEEQPGEKPSFFVSFSVLGFEFAAEISLDEVKAALRAEMKERDDMDSQKDYDTDFSDSKDEDHDLKKSDPPPVPNVPLKKMRVFHFMVPTAAEEVLVKSFLESQNEISVLCTQRDSTRKLKRIGKASLPVLGFKNPHIKKMDLFAVFGLDLGKALVRATVGLDRAEQNMSTAAIARATKLYDFGSLVVPEQTYFSPKSLPAEWIESLGIKALHVDDAHDVTNKSLGQAQSGGQLVPEGSTRRERDGGGREEGTGHGESHGSESASPIVVISGSDSGTPYFSGNRRDAGATTLSTSSPTTQMTVWSIRVDIASASNMPMNTATVSELDGLTCVAAYDFGDGRRKTEGRIVNSKLVEFDTIQQHLFSGELQAIAAFFREHPNVEVTLSVHSPSLRSHLHELVSSAFALVDKDGTKCITTEQLYRGLELNGNLVDTLASPSNTDHLAALPGGTNFTPEIFADLLVRGTKAKLRDTLGLATSVEDLPSHSPVTIVTTFEDFLHTSFASARLWHIFSFCCGQGNGEVGGGGSDEDLFEDEFEDDFEDDWEDESGEKSKDETDAEQGVGVSKNALTASQRCSNDLGADEKDGEGKETEAREEDKKYAAQLKLKQKVSLRTIKDALEKSGASSDALIVDSRGDCSSRFIIEQRNRFIQKLEEFCTEVLPSNNEGIQLSWDDFLKVGVPFLLNDVEKDAMVRSGGIGNDEVAPYGAPLLQLKASIDLSELVKDGACDGTWLLLDDDSGDDLIPISPHQYPPYVCASVRLTKVRMPSTTEVDMDLR